MRYVLLQSNIQHEVAIALGVKDAGNEAVRGECMARVLCMLCWKGMGGIAWAVLEALLRY